MLQFCSTSTKAEPWWKPARSRVPCRCSVCVSTERATNGPSAASAGEAPDQEVRARRLQAGGQRRSAAVDGVEAERVHVVRQAPRAADAGDEDDLLARVAEVRHDLLGLGEDRVVAAAGTPADLLVRDEVLAREREGLAGLSGRLGGYRVGHRRRLPQRPARICSARSWISEIRKALPRTLS